MKRFVLKMMKGNKKEYLLLMSVLSLVVSFLYVFLSLYDVMADIHTADLVSNMGIDFINFIALCLSVVTVIVVNYYFIEERTQEYALLLLTGRNRKEIVFYIFIQFGSILFLSFVLGGVLGAIWIVLMNRFYMIMGFDFMINQPFILLYILLFIVCMLFIIVFNIARFNHIEIKINDYLRNKIQTSTRVPKKATTQYLIMSLLGFMFIFSSHQLTLSQDITISSIICFIGVIAGIILVSTSLIPFIYYSFHNTLVLKSKKVMFIFNGFMELISTIEFPFILNCLMIPILLISILALEIEVLKYVMITCYLFVLLIIMICFILQFNLYNKSLIYKLDILKSLGYRKNNVKMIQFVQVILFFIVSILLLISFSGLLYKGYLQGIINSQMFILFVGSYIFVYLSICIYMNVKFNQSIKEAYSYEKHFNRG